MRQIKPTSKGLGANKDVNGAGFDVGIEMGEILAFFIVTVKTGDFGFGEEAGEFGFEEFGTETFMDNTRDLTAGARFGHFFLVATEVTDECIAIGVKGHREVAIGAEGLPTAVFTESERSGTAAVMKNQGLAVVFEILPDVFE